MIKRERDVEAKVLSPGVERKILSYNEDLMLCSFELKKGSGVAEHSHTNVQTSYIISGKVRFYIGDEVHILEAGDNAFMEANVSHKVEVLEDSKIIDVFTPMRKDFIE